MAKETAHQIEITFLIDLLVETPELKDVWWKHDLWNWKRHRFTNHYRRFKIGSEPKLENKDIVSETLQSYDHCNWLPNK
jgi:hypothetical protein